jgi:hypothetical protein
MILNVLPVDNGSQKKNKQQSRYTVDDRSGHFIARMNHFSHFKPWKQHQQIQGPTAVVRSESVAGGGGGGGGNDGGGQLAPVQKRKEPAGEELEENAHLDAPEQVSTCALFKDDMEENLPGPK